MQRFRKRSDVEIDYKAELAKAREGIDSFKIISVLDIENFGDFEDCFQEKCAAAVSADYIVMRNTKIVRKYRRAPAEKRREQNAFSGYRWFRGQADLSKGK